MNPFIYLHCRYTPNNLESAPYDWRLPLPTMEERDSYFIRLRLRIEATVKINDAKVSIIHPSPPPPPPLRSCNEQRICLTPRSFPVVLARQFLVSCLGGMGDCL